jgi:hypothetical protein
MNHIARVLPFLDAGVGPDPTFPDIDKATADLFLLPIFSCATDFGRRKKNCTMPRVLI